MGYSLALESAGAKVLDYEQFGDYQGSWIAKVSYKGAVGYIRGFYGSCSGCDAFEAEFDFSCCDEHGDIWYEEAVENSASCVYCKNYVDRMIKFGEGYLTGGVEPLQSFAEGYFDTLYVDKEEFNWVCNQLDETDILQKELKESLLKAMEEYVAKYG